MGWEGGRLEEVQQTKELFDAVLQRSAGQQHPVLEVEALQPLEQLAVSVLEAVSFVNDHHSPLDAL